MYQRLLVPLDGSATSLAALDTALRMARENGARVRLVHMVEEMFHGGFDLLGANSAQFVQALRGNAQRVLDEGLARAAKAGVPADCVLHDTFGKRLADVVRDCAKQWNADVIVAGTHGRRGVDRLVMGSGAEQIVRTAPVPVLIVRSPGEG